METMAHFSTLGAGTQARIGGLLGLPLLAWNPALPAGSQSPGMLISTKTEAVLLSSTEANAIEEAVFWPRGNALSLELGF